MAHVSATKLTIAQLHAAIDEPTLRAFFAPFGEIVSIDMGTVPPTAMTHSGAGEGRKTGTVARKTGHATIEYEEAEDAAAALDNMSDAELFGQYITVDRADTRMTFDGLGSTVPLWEQEGFIQRYLVDSGANAADTTTSHADVMQGLEQTANLPVSVGPMPVTSGGK